jgi:hypothetical protein
MIAKVFNAAAVAALVGLATAACQSPSSSGGTSSSGASGGSTSSSSADPCGNLQGAARDECVRKQTGIGTGVRPEKGTTSGGGY